MFWLNYNLRFIFLYQSSPSNTFELFPSIVFDVLLDFMNVGVLFSCSLAESLWFLVCFYKLKWFDCLAGLKLARSMMFPISILDILFFLGWTLLFLFFKEFYSLPFACDYLREMSYCLGEFFCKWFKFFLLLPFFIGLLTLTWYFYDILLSIAYCYCECNEDFYTVLVKYIFS